MKQHVAIALCSALCSSWCAVTLADTVHRCEGRDGKVTYSNTQCPTGTSPVRKVNTDPPVSIDDQKAAKERTRRETEQVKQAEKEREDEKAKTDREANERKKVDAKADQKCDKARRDLEAARSKRADLSSQVATIEQINKADADVKRRESDLAKECPR